MLALAVVVSLPCRANAETPAQFYNNLASALGVALDVEGQAWQDKTKAAYLAYLEQNMTQSLTSPNAIYDSAWQLEGLTGYDIVYAEGGILYMNTVTDGAGGAFGGVQVWWPNYSSLLEQYTRWVRLAVSEGPAWPSGEGSTGGSDETISGIFGQTYGFSTYYYGTNSSQHVTYGGKSYYISTDYVNAHDGSLIYPNTYTLTFGNNPSTTVQNKINQILTDINNGSDFAILVAWRISGTSASIGSVYIYTFESGTSEVKWTTRGSDTFPNGVTGTLLHGYLFNSITQTGLQTYDVNVTSGSAQTSIFLSAQGAGLITNASIGGGGTGGGGATDDNPPSGGGDILPITITWPDLSYTGPTYNYEGDTYNTTSGDIDWSPVTDRLDEMAEEFELYANSFEDFRSDFLQMWHALGGGLQDLSGQLTAIENKLNRVLDWLINIFNKVPGGAAATQPNPDTDEGGFWDWLGRLLEKLLGNLPETTQNFQSALAQLTGRFPFSVPWDLAAMLGLFAHDPITPNVTFYLPTVTQGGFVYDAQQAVPLVIDCSDYDDVAALARRLEFITFAIMLAKWTIEGIKGIDWTLFG